MSKTHFSLRRMEKIAKGKVKYVILEGDLEVYSSKNFFESIQVLDSLQRRNSEKEYKFAVMEVE